MIRQIKRALVKLTLIALEAIEAKRQPKKQSRTISLEEKMEMQRQWVRAQREGRR